MLLLEKYALKIWKCRLDKGIKIQHKLQYAAMVSCLQHANMLLGITITMLLCKELILIRGQPPRQGGSPRATLDRGEFT